MNNITDIKLTTTAAARIAQNEIAAKAIAIFGSEAVTTDCEIVRKTGNVGIVYSANAHLTVTVDLTKTDLAKRWIAAADAGIAKGLKADDCRIAGRTDVNEWDRETINLARITGADKRTIPNGDPLLKPRQIWSICVEAECLPKDVRCQPYSDKWFRNTYTTGEWVRTEVSIEEVAALTVERTASIDAITAYCVTGSLNGRRYNSDNRAFKVGTFIEAGATAATELSDRLESQVIQVENFVERFDLAAETAKVAAREAEFNQRKARADWINGQIAQANRDSGAESSYDRRQIAEYSADGLAAGRLDIRTGNLTVDEVNAIIAILTGAGRRIATGPIAGTVGA